MLEITSLNEPGRTVAPQGSRLKTALRSGSLAAASNGGRTPSFSSSAHGNAQGPPNSAPGSVSAQGLIISNLTTAVRDTNRVNVFINGKFRFSLDIAQVVEYGVKVGQTLSPDRLAELESASEFGKLYQRTLEWVLTRPHSIRETRDYLRRRKQKRWQLNQSRAREGKKPLPDLKEETFELVISRLVERGYLDDYKFAKFFVENRFSRRGISQKRLELELSKKGIDKSIIAEVLKDGSRSESEEIAKVIQKKRTKYDDQKLLAYLVHQGFDYNAAKTAIENYEDSSALF